MDIQNHQQLCSFNELSRSRGSWVGSCWSLTASWPLRAEHSRATLSPRALAPGFDVPSQHRQGQGCSQINLPQHGDFCRMSHWGGIRRRSSSSTSLPHGSLSAAAWGHTRSTRGDSVGLAASAPPARAAPSWSSPGAGGTLPQPRSRPGWVPGTC